MVVTSSTLSELDAQAKKIEAPVDWSGMAVNVQKCAVPGVLWGQAQRSGSIRVLSAGMIRMLKSRLQQVTIQGSPTHTGIPFCIPTMSRRDTLA